MSDTVDMLACVICGNPCSDGLTCSVTCLESFEIARILEVNKKRDHPLKSGTQREYTPGFVAVSLDAWVVQLNKHFSGVDSPSIVQPQIQQEICRNTGWCGCLICRKKYNWPAVKPTETKEENDTVWLPTAKVVKEKQFGVYRENKCTVADMPNPQDK